MTSEPIRLARQRLRQQLIDQDVLLDRLLIALLTSGHVLIEGPPGIAKTRTVKAFAQQLDASFARIQATPDLLPADLTGTELYQPNSGDFLFRKGPLFHHIVLMDEINRAPPKVQSALLEAMGENQITTAGITRRLEEPFLVAATQNPIEHEGTYPLPEAQLDRFMFLVELELPKASRERRILDHVLSERTNATTDVPDSAPIQRTELADVIRARHAVTHVHISDAIRDYIVRLTMATRATTEKDADDSIGIILQAASPRGSLFLAQAAQALAWLEDRDHVVPDDVRTLAADVLCGRIALDYRSRAAGHTHRSVIETLIANTPPV